MSALYDTLLLDTATWDLTVDAAGDIAMASPVYSVAQDVASAIRVFLGECYYDTTLGIPYSQRILSYPLNPSFIKQQIQRVALTVPGVLQAVCYISSFTERAVTGQVQVTTNQSVTIPVNF